MTHMTRSETRTDGGQLILRARLGARLSQYREHAGITIRDAARHAGVHESTLSRIENGKQSTKVAYIRSWASQYEVPHLEAELVDLAERAAAPGWWTSFGADPWVREMLARECVAEQLDIYEIALVPGIFQTEPYIRGLRAAAVPDALEEDTARLVAFRLARQQHLLDGGAPKIRVVLDEAVLLRPIGSPQAWRGQLKHLATAAKAGVALHVLPLDVGAHPAMGVPFSILTVAEEPALDAVYLEDDRSGRELQRPADLHHYHGIFDRLTSMSWPVEQSVAYLSRLARNA